MVIKTREEALEQLKALPPKALIRIANLSTNSKIVKVFNCPIQYPILKHKIDAQL